MTTKEKNQKNHYESKLNSWISDEKAALQFINVIGQLWYDKGIEMILFRHRLLDCGASDILYKHSYAENIVKKPLRVQDSLMLAETISKLNFVPARIDIGRLNKEWMENSKNYADVEAFVSDRLSSFINGDITKSDIQPKDVVLFGFGRIGRLVARELIRQAGNGSQLRLRAIVTRSNSPSDIQKRASLFRKDSVHGHFEGVAVEDIENEALYINGHLVKMITASAPDQVDYSQYGITDALLIDNTGVYRDREGLSKHLKSKGISKVLLTAPGKGDIPNIVYGVNHQTEFNESCEETIFSAASCTTNAVVPVLSVIETEFGIVKGHLETIHSYTNDQNLLDNFHKKYRRGRGAPLNMVITETGAAKAAVIAIPSLKGKLTANAVRVPTPNVSLAILTLTIATKTYRDQVNEVLKSAALQGNLVEQIRYSTSNEMVSNDCIGDSCSAIVDSPATLVSKDGKDIVVYAWYDNEYGYTRQVIRLAKHIAEVRRMRYY